MPQRHRPLYPPEFRRQMVELVRTGRDPEQLAREFEPSAQAIRNWVAQADRDEGRLWRPVEGFFPNVIAIDVDTTGSWPFGHRLNDRRRLLHQVPARQAPYPSCSSWRSKTTGSAPTGPRPCPQEPLYASRMKWSKTLRVKASPILAVTVWSSARWRGWSCSTCSTGW